MMLTIFVCIVMFLIIYKIIKYITLDVRLSIILSLIFLFQFLIFPEFISYTGEISVYYMEIMYDFDLIPTDTPVVFLIFWFFINILSIPEFLIFNLFRAIVTTLSAFYIFKIINYKKTDYNYKKTDYNYKEIGYLCIFLFGFNYIQFFYLAGDQFKNLFGNLMYIILVYYLIRKPDIRNILYIILFSTLALLSHKMYWYIIPLTLCMSIMLNYKRFNSITFISIFSFIIIIFLRIQDQFRILDIGFLNGYLDYSGKYQLIDGFNHLGNTLTFFIGVILIIYFIIRHRKIRFDKKYLLLFYIFLQLFVLSHSYLLGVVLTPFRFTMVNLPLICLFISILLYKNININRIYYYIFGFVYVILNIAFIQFSVNSSEEDCNNIFLYLLNSLNDINFIFGDYTVYIIGILLCLLMIVVSTYIKE